MQDVHGGMLKRQKEVLQPLGKVGVGGMKDAWHCRLRWREEEELTESEWSWKSSWAGLQAERSELPPGFPHAECAGGIFPFHMLNYEAWRVFYRSCYFTF